MKKEDAKRMVKESYSYRERQQKAYQTAATIAFGLTVIFSFYHCYGWIQPDSLGTFIIYIIASIVSSFAFMIPVSLIGHILKLF